MGYAGLFSSVYLYPPPCNQHCSCIPVSSSMLPILLLYTCILLHATNTAPVYLYPPPCYQYCSCIYLYPPPCYQNCSCIPVSSSMLPTLLLLLLLFCFLEKRADPFLCLFCPSTFLITPGSKGTLSKHCLY